MTQTVRVAQLKEKGLCLVEMKRESACGGNCTSCGGCESPNETILALAVNAAGASAGDTVVVESTGKDIFKIAALVYLLPIVLLIGGYIVAQVVIQSSPVWIHYTAMPGIASAVGFIAGVLVAIGYGKKQKNKVWLTVARIL